MVLYPLRVSADGPSFLESYVDGVDSENIVAVFVRLLRTASTFYYLQMEVPPGPRCPRLMALPQVRWGS